MSASNVCSNKFDVGWDAKQLSNNLLLLDVISLNEAKMLTDQKIDGMCLLDMTESDFNELGFLMGPRKKIMRFVEQIKSASIERKAMINVKQELGAGDVPVIRSLHLDSQQPLSPTSRARYSCFVCGKHYSKKQYVFDHERNEHLKSAVNYSCKLCGQSFGWRSSILKHIKQCHRVSKTTPMIESLFV